MPVLRLRRRRRSANFKLDTHTGTQARSNDSDVPRTQARPGLQVELEFCQRQCKLKLKRTRITMIVQTEVIIPGTLLCHSDLPSAWQAVPLLF